MITFSLAAREVNLSWMLRERGELGPSGGRGNSEGYGDDWGEGDDSDAPLPLSSPTLPPDLLALHREALILPPPLPSSDVSQPIGRIPLILQSSAQRPPPQ